MSEEAILNCQVCGLPLEDWEEETCEACGIMSVLIQEPPAVVAEVEITPSPSEIQPQPSPLEQFTYSIRHRVERPFASGDYEGRMKLGTYEYIISATTLEDVMANMTVKADTLLKGGYVRARG